MKIVGAKSCRSCQKIRPLEATWALSDWAVQILVSTACKWMTPVWIYPSYWFPVSTLTCPSLQSRSCLGESNLSLDSLKTSSTNLGSSYFPHHSLNNIELIRIGFLLSFLAYCHFVLRDFHTAPWHKAQSQNMGSLVAKLTLSPALHKLLVPLIFHS